MKRLISLALSATLVLSALPLSARAATGDQTTVQQVVGALGIITGDASGNLRLTAPVTRAEFAKMLVSASSYKDTVSAAGNASPFKDVPYTHWASSYIKTAVNQGWLTGYLDGSYRPENPVTTAEAATAVLKLLGYTATDFSGSYPYAQMALYRSLKLSEGISAGSTTAMTRQNCMRLFYNLLSVDLKDGSKTYMEQLGYKLDSNGDPDYNALLQSTMDGPVVFTSGNVYGTLGFTPTTVYRNGATATTSALQRYDVLYYSAARGTVWAYSRRITGTYEAATPNKESPTSVTVAGVTYTVDTPSAITQLSTEGGLAIGSSITILLGKDGGIVAAYPASTLTTDFVGLVTAVNKSSYTNADGSTYTAKTLTVLAADGQTYTVPVTTLDSTITTGTLVRATYTNAGASVKYLSKNSLTGKVTTAGVGNYRFADDVNILDIADGTGVRVYPSRLAGMTLQNGDVYYYELNTEGKIATLLLGDVTGDCYTYGIATQATLNQGEANYTVNYSFLIDGKTTALTTNGTMFTLGTSTGPAKLLLSGGTVTRATKLTELKNVVALTDQTIKSADETHTIWDRAAVYVVRDGIYTQIERSSLSLSAYHVRAYYDDTDANGGRVRVLIATPVT